MKDYYQILGVLFSASQEEIKGAFRALIQKYHPDKNATPEATERTREIIEAYKILTDSDAKYRYDQIYNHYYGSKAQPNEKQNSQRTTERKTTVPDDPILQKWIRAAQRQARVEIETLIKDLPEAVGVAAKGAFQHVCYYLLFSIGLLLLMKGCVSNPL